MTAPEGTPVPAPDGDARDLGRAWPAYACLVGASMMWSAVGLLVKASTPMVGCHVLSCCRFVFGVLFLIGFMRLAGLPLRLELRHPLIWLAAAGKAVNYILENLGISLGPAWGNVIVGPVQTVALVLLAAAFLGERTTLRRLVAVAGCIAGVLLLKGKGGGPGLTPAVILLMTLSGVGAAVHVYCSRRLAGAMESLGLNTSVFLVASLITALPLPVVGAVTGPIQALPVLAVLGLGLITGLSFHLFTLSIRTIPMIQVAVLSNVGFLFTPVWSWLAFGTPIGLRVLAGVFLSLAGVVLVSLPASRPPAGRAAQKG